MTASVLQTPGAQPAAPPRRRGAWVVIAVAVLLIGAAGAALSSALQWSQRGLLDPDSRGQAGTRALAEVLREQGVDVRVVRDRDAADAALDAHATLVLASTSPLSDDAVAGLAGAAGDVVLVDPSGRDMRLLFEGAESAGYAAGDPVEPACDQPDAARAGAIVPGAVFTAGELAGTVGCYRSGEGYGLLALDRSPTSRVVALDARDLFTNAQLADDGNAGLALGLLGRHPRLVWYLPSPQDADAGTAAPTLGELTPPWVTPAIVLLLCAGVVAAVWRGRRFGPLVAESLPVTVRASETMEGRARLYARSRDTAHALDALRDGALERIGGMLGLGPGAGAADVADAAADRLGVPRAVVRGILIDSVPATEAGLVAASDRLRDLEAAVRASVHVERTDP